MEYKIINLLQTRELRANFTRSEESLLDFIEKNFEKIPEYSVMKLCQEAYTSQATVNRVCKKLGFKGFSELKFSVNEDLEKMGISEKIHTTDTLFYIKNINFAGANKVAEIIRCNRKILLYGLGASQITATYMQRQLLYLGFEAIVISEERMIDHFHDFILLVISSSGETPRIKHVAKNFIDKGKLVISISKKGSSLDELSKSSFTHNIAIDKLDVRVREQQLHMFIMVNELINRL